MHVIHALNGKRADEHVSDNNNVGFLISNKRGNYLSLGRENFSHTQGLFFFDNHKWELYKTIEDIKLDGEITTIKNNFYNVQRIYMGGVAESFNLFNDSMLYSVKNYVGEIVIELDFRAMFDFDDKGRIYSITQEDDFIIIRFDKYTDDSKSQISSTKFLVIKGAREFRQIGEWIRKNYSYDEKRRSRSEFYVYKAMGLKVDKRLDLAFSFSDDQAKAKEHAQKIYNNKDYLVDSLKKYVSHTFTSRDLALNTAMKALDDLLVSVESKDRGVGVFAGLPWFYQLWARDELISLRALMLQDKHYLVKSILLKYMNSISADGMLPNILPAKEGDMKSIDAIGWLFKRTKDYLELLEKKKIMNEYLSVMELTQIKRGLEKVIQGLVHYHSSEDLIINEEQETWMDTKPAKRKGACIEIQALFLSMISLHNQIAGITNSKQIFKGLEKGLKQRIKQAFFVDGMLQDSVLSSTYVGIRPNVFLAYYIYPGLLTKKEWKQVFDNALSALWADWGGVSSISHKSPLFRSEYSGEGDESYHNGDSWFFINNYAALAMKRLDKNYYAKYINRIIHASREEMLFSGFVGCCAEISSSKHLRSEGCLSQAWSAASFVELLYEMHLQTPRRT